MSGRERISLVPNEFEPTTDAEPERLESAPLAYENGAFLDSPDGRPLRIMAEYTEPLARFRRERIQDTVVFFGSARFGGLDEAQKKLSTLEKPGSEASTPSGNQDKNAQQALLKRAQAGVEMARYYEDARQLARLLTEWSIT